MYYPYVQIYPYPYYVVQPYNNNRQIGYPGWPAPLGQGESHHYWYVPNEDNRVVLKDYGKQPFTVDIEKSAEQNSKYRRALWTGEHLQVTLMSIEVGGDIGLEVHPDTDQFLRIEEGRGVVQMGDSKDNLTFRKNVREDSAIMVPAGTWHNLTNTGKRPLKLYTIYAPPEHPFGTIHTTKEDALAAENHN